MEKQIDLEEAIAAKLPARHLATVNLFREADNSIHVTFAEARGVAEEVAGSGAPIYPLALNALRAAVELRPAPPAEIDNPTRWFYASSFDAEWWHLGGDTREETIAKGRAEWPGEAFYVVEAKREVPNFNIFNAEQINDRLQDDERVGEDGWEGGHIDGPHADELERRLAATLREWFAECCDLHGMMLDFTQGPDKIETESHA